MSHTLATITIKIEGQITIRVVHLRRAFVPENGVMAIFGLQRQI